MSTRIVVLTPDAGGSHGVAAVTRQLVRALAAAPGGACEVWALDRADVAEPPWPGVSRSAHGSRTRLSSWGLGELSRSASDTLVVATHLHLAPVAAPIMARGGRLAILLLGIEAWLPLGGLRRWALERATLLAISRETVRRFHEANPSLAQRPVAVCHPGVTPAEPDAVERWIGGRRNQHPKTLIVGRMASGERYKGHDELLGVWSRVVAVVPGATLVIVGDGDDRPRLEAKSRALGVAEHVEFLGRVDDRTLANLYETSSLFAMPSRNEGFGLVYLEAMRVGLPCVAGPGAAEEMIDEGRSGWIVDPMDPATLTTVLVEALSDPARRATVGRTAAARARDFSEARFAECVRSALGL